jgi:hypothetical protein
VSPLVAWLASNELGPLHYLAGRASLEGAKRTEFSAAKFVIGLVFSAAPLFLLMAWCGFIRLGWPTDARATGGIVASPATPRHRVRFLIFVALGPPLLSVIVAVLFNARLRTAWGDPMSAR